MIVDAFTESGMTFGPFPDGHCFRIETSKTYLKVQDGVPIAEFLYLHTVAEKKYIYIVEAKSSTPRPTTQPEFDAFIADIAEKLKNALMLTLATGLGRHPESRHELETPFMELDLAQTNLFFVLIVNGHRDDWLPPLRDALNKKLHSVVKTWALTPSAVVVLNDRLAREKKLIA